VGRSGGILGGFRQTRFSICDTSMGKFFIKATLMDLKLYAKWCLIIVYGAAKMCDKDDFLVAREFMLLIFILVFGEYKVRGD
jgi:hypothetical protein